MLGSILVAGQIGKANGQPWEGYFLGALLGVLGVVIMLTVLVLDAKHRAAVKLASDT